MTIRGTAQLNVGIQKASSPSQGAAGGGWWFGWGGLIRGLVVIKKHVVIKGHVVITEDGVGIRDQPTQ